CLSSPFCNWSFFHGHPQRVCVTSALWCGLPRSKHKDWMRLSKQRIKPWPLASRRPIFFQARLLALIAYLTGFLWKRIHQPKALRPKVRTAALALGLVCVVVGLSSTANAASHTIYVEDCFFSTTSQP